MTDEYLVQDASYNRLRNEYEEYKSLVICYDFDNTVFDFHKKGNTYHQVIKLLQDLKKANCILICFTANSDSEFVINYCKENNIPIDKLNENPDFFKCDSRKIYYNALLDDRAGLYQTYYELKTLINYLKYTKQISE